MNNAETYLLDTLVKIDSAISEEEKALVQMQKQIGNKLNKIANLRTERAKVLSAYNEVNAKEEN